MKTKQNNKFYLNIIDIIKGTKNYKISWFNLIILVIFIQLCNSNYVLFIFDRTLQVKFFWYEVSICSCTFKHNKSNTQMNQTIKNLK